MQNLIIIFLLLSVSGCSALKNLKFHTKSREPVVTANIVSEKFDGENLKVLLQVNSTEELPFKEVALRFRLLNNGEIINTDFYPLNHLVRRPGKLLIANQPLEITLIGSLVKGSTSRITDYQIELLWGEEALSSTAKEIKNKILTEVEEIEREEKCDQTGKVCKDLIRSIVKIHHDLGNSDLKTSTDLTHNAIVCKSLILRAQLFVDQKPSKLTTIKLPETRVKAGELRYVRLKFSDLIDKNANVDARVTVDKCIQ